MSVWESTTYKVDLARAIWEYLHPLHERILGKTIGDYLQPKGDLANVAPDDDWEVLADECEWDKKLIDDISQEEVEKLTSKVTSWSIGVSAIYKLIEARHKGRFDVREQYAYEVIARRARAVGSVVAASTAIAPDVFKTKWDAGTEDVLKMARKFEDFAEAWKFAIRKMDRDLHEYNEIEQERLFGYGNRIYYGGTIGPLVILVGCDIYTNRGLVLTKTHLSILVEACSRISNLLEYAAREYYENTVIQTRIIKVLSLTISRASGASGFNADKVVQAFHKARSYMQMVLFRNLMNNALKDALKEYISKNLQTILPMVDYIRCFDNIPRGHWLDLMNVYKWMPPPDFDATYAFAELKGYHTSCRKSGLSLGASEEMRGIWKLIVEERKLNIAQAYRDIHNDWPAGLKVEDDFPTLEGIREWEPKGLFAYHTYGKDVTSQIKDKTTVMPTVREEINVHPHNLDKSFLLWYLRNKKLIDTRKYAVDYGLGSFPEENFARVAYKGEAHKPGSRLFFMAPPIQRILLGEMEGNISRLAKHYPASLQGLGALDRSTKLDYLFDVYDTSFVSKVEDDYTSYVVTFDLSKFSPRFNPEVLEDLHDFWANVFSYEPIRRFGAIGARGVILHTTNNLVMKYRNQGADLEGFRGRMMTLFHADLLGAACRLAQARGHIVGKSIGLVFIDDGAVRIAARGLGDTAMKNALAFLEVMQLVYAAAGQENHPNKTIVSAIGGELLAEQYMYGQKLRCPIKAGMRVYPDYENPASCISEEFDAMFASIQGSVRDGALWVSSYRRYCDAMLKAIYRWARYEFRKLDDVRFAIKFVTPKSCGGFGFPSLQALVSTTAYDLTSEGLGVLNSAGRCYELYAPLVKQVISRPVIIREPLAILKDPGRVRLNGPILVEGRLLNALVKRLSSTNGPWAELISEYNAPALTEHAVQVAEAVLGDISISLPVIQRVWNSTPLAYVESIVQKFQRADSILAILGKKEVAHIRNQNTKDVRVLLRNFF